MRKKVNIIAFSVALIAVILAMKHTNYRYDKIKKSIETDTFKHIGGKDSATYLEWEKEYYQEPIM